MTTAGQRHGPGMPAGGTVIAQLADVRVSITTAYTPFMEYAGIHMTPLQTTLGEPLQVQSTLRWHEGPPPADRLAAYPALRSMERVDRDLYRSDNQLAWFRADDFPDLHLQFAWDGERLQVEGNYFHRLSKDVKRDRLKRMLYHRRLPELRRRRFTTLLYYLVYYPCFWWLERKRDLHPIHAAGAQIGDAVVVLAGPSGVGKSTLVAGIAASPSARLLSDTFLLQRGTSVKAVPEPLLLDKWSQNWLGAEASLLRAIPHRYCLDRDGFHWAGDRLSVGGQVRLLLFPQRATTHYVRPISPVQAQGRVRAGDLIVNDLRRYWAYSSVLQLLDPTPLVQAREEQLAVLVRNVPVYEVGLTSDLSRQAITELVEQLMQAGAAGSGRVRRIGQAEGAS